ncbi:MAG: hypothetical protein PHG81_11265 [Aliarcobacter sp.]|nr:hypothetical protein [Aliarcobacter sp.]
MNFENYNKIYQEILNDEKDELTANYILNKYEINHEEELINILNQIKKNEYISSDNKVINRLLNELDENEDLLNIYEIINVKEKVINHKTVESYINEEEKDLKKENIKDTNKDSFNIKTSIIDNKKIKKYTLYILPLIILLVIFLLNSSNNKGKTTLPLSTEKVEKTNQEEKKVKEIKIEESIKIKEELPQIRETVKEEISLIKEEVGETLIDTESISDNNEIILSSIDQIEKFKNELKYEGEGLIFRDKIYHENDMLFGFKIYKLTSVYVKFQDEEKQIRKRLLLKQQDKE